MKRILKIAGMIVLVVIAVITLLLVYMRYRMHHVKDRKNLKAAVHQEAQKFVQSGKTIGLVVGIYKDGITSIEGFGTRDRSSSVKPDSTTLFELASTSKLFTTSLLLILCERGLLQLDDKIAPLLKEKVSLPPIAQQTTLRHLATHTSGFPSLPASFIEKMQDESNPYKDLTTRDLYDYLKTCSGKQKEGTYEYSNLGMGLLGHILEVKTGKPLEALIKEELLLPLGMQQTRITLSDSLQQQLATGYTEKNIRAPVWVDTVLTGAGSFLSTANDMIRFIRANLDVKSPLFPILAKGHRAQFNGPTGLGWHMPTAVDRFMGNNTIIWHNGMAGGYASFISIDPTTNSGLIVLSNKAEDVTTFGMQLTRLVSTQSWE